MSGIFSHEEYINGIISHVKCFLPNPEERDLGADRTLNIWIGEHFFAFRRREWNQPACKIVH